MSDIIVTGSSGYATGSIDSATVLISNVSTISARHPNGCASAIVQVETILGSGTALKGTQADLATRLAAALNPSGTIALTGFVGLTADRGLTAISASQLQVMNHTPIGMVVAFGGFAAPANWLLCDGQAVSRTTYQKLFSVIDTSYGVGNGSTTFNLPDRRGRVGIGIDGTANRVTSASTGGANADTRGGVGGNENLPAHVHQEQAMDGSGGVDLMRSIGATGGSLLRTLTETVDVTATDQGALNTASTGTGGVTGVMNPWQTFNYIIFAGV